MKKIKVTLDIGFPTARRTTEFEIDDDCDYSEIDEMAEEWAMQYVDIYWDEVKK